MGYAGRQNIYEATIKRMVREAIELQEKNFAEEHSNDTNEQLLSYLKSCFNQLSHVPWQMEVVGGTMIAERFGSWNQALIAAGFSTDLARKKPKTFLRMQEETMRQKEIYHQRKVAKKQKAEAGKSPQGMK